MLGLAAGVSSKAMQLWIAPENLFGSAQKLSMIAPAGNAEACTGDRCSDAAIVASPDGAGR